MSSFRAWLDGFITGGFAFGIVGFVVGVVQRPHALTTILDWCIK